MLPSGLSGPWANLVDIVGTFWLGAFFFGALFVGVSAALFGLLRLWPMHWLLRICLAESTNPNVELDLTDTLLLFESPLLSRPKELVRLISTSC